MRLTSSDEAAIFRSVKRACDAGFDSITLRREVVRRLAPMVPHAAYSFSTTDPDTGLPTHAVGAGMPAGAVRMYVETQYPMEVAMQTLHRARIGPTVSTSTSDIFRERLRAEGVEHQLDLILCAGGGVWGDLHLLRTTGSPDYGEREIRFMERIAPHVARGLKSAVLMDAAKAADRDTGDGEPSAANGSGPGVLILDTLGRTRMRNAAAADQIRDLADVGMGIGATPYAIASVLALLRTRRAAGGQPTDLPGDAELRVRGRSGRWYTLRASSSEPDAMDAIMESAIIVTIQPVAPGEVASILARLYGLTRREREVLGLAARGESTKEIAARLGLSAYTVQEHFGRACEKVGVRGRRALLARLFFDGYAPRPEA